MRHLLYFFIFTIVLFLPQCKDVDDGTLQRHPVHLIYDFEPKKGNAGTIVTITGSYFSPTATDNIVKFAGLEAEVMSASASELQVKAPYNVVTGRITVTINNIMAPTSDDFIVE